MRFKIIISLFLLLALIGCSVEKKQIEQEPIVQQPKELDQEKIKPLEPVSPDIIDINLTKQKTMVPDNISIKKGTIVRWHNFDDKDYYHNIILFKGDLETFYPKDVIDQSGNINPGDYWEYEFKEKGTFVVKDIYSGTMRGKITADAVKDIDSSISGVIIVR